MITARHFFKLSFALIVLAYGTASAQVPSGAILWLRADTGLDTTPNGIRVWRDQSGLHNDATQSDTNHRPIPLASGINGLPTVHFGGNSFFNAPAIFPKFHDYSVSGVIRLTDTSALSNVLSGVHHAVWFNSCSYLGVLHLMLPLGATASAPMSPKGSCFLISFNASQSTVHLYIDGLLTDSLWIPYNDDSLLMVGSFGPGYYMHGDISELLLYDRALDSPDVARLDSYLQQKYNLSVRSAPILDTTFVQIPARFQFFPRNNQDSASIVVSGILRQPGFDSIHIETMRNGAVIAHAVEPLSYSDGAAPFRFQTSIHAELSEFAVRVRVTRGSYDSILAYRDSLVCGDAYLICGQSNAIFGFVGPYTLNEYCRTFGITSNHNAKDTLWSIAQSFWIGYGNCICAWSFQFAQLISDSLHIPVCVIDGATPGGTIEDHLRNDADPLDVNTPYGRMLYRVQKAHLDRAVKAIVWDQGEWNTALNYQTNFERLHSAWLQDYPSLERTYVVQIRPDDCGYPHDERGLKEIQRDFQSTVANVTSLATAAMPLHNGCHLGDSGWRVWGTQMYHLLGRDFYQSTDTVDIASPDIRTVFYTSAAHDSIRLMFDPPSSHLAITNDTIVGGKLRTMRDYFYLDDLPGFVRSIRVDGNALVMGVSNPVAQTITYLPDHYYPDDTTVVYEGPWIVTARGVSALIFYDVPISSGMAVGNSEHGALSIRAIENPAHRRLELAISGSEVVRLDIFDDLGRALVSTLLRLNATQPFTFSSELSMRSSTAYFCRISDARGEAQTIIVACEH